MKTGLAGRTHLASHHTTIASERTGRTWLVSSDRKGPRQSMIDYKKLKLLISYCMSWTTQTSSWTISESRFAQLRSQGTTLTLPREAGSVILKIAYGYKAEPFKEDILIKMAGQAMDDVTAAGVPGAFLVDILPLCKPPQTQPLPINANHSHSQCDTYQTGFQARTSRDLPRNGLQNWTI